MTTAQVAERFPTLPEGDSPFDRMIRGLRRKDPELNEICTDILVRSQTEGGGNGVSRLLVEATLPGRQPDHRIRILEVVRRIGAPLSPDDFFTVMALTNHPVERVALKATELIVELRAAQPRAIPKKSRRPDESSVDRSTKPEMSEPA